MYSTLADLEYFGHKDFEYFCSSKIIQALNRGGSNYNAKVVKCLQGLVWKAPEMKGINQPLLISTNLTRDKANNCYFKAVFEMSKLKKEFEIVSPGNLFTLSGVSETNKSRIYSLKSSTL